MAKVTMKTVGGAEIVLESNNDKDLFRQMSFWGSLPTHCPIDDTPTRLEVRKVDKFTYYSVVSGEGWKVHCGQSEEGDTLFARLNDGWKRWNGTEEEVAYPSKTGRATTTPKAPAGKPATAQASPTEIPLMTADEVEELKEDLRGMGLSSQKEANNFLKKLNRKPGDWSNFTYDEASTILTLAKDAYAPEPPESLF